MVVSTAKCINASIKVSKKLVGVCVIINFFVCLGKESDRCDMDLVEAVKVLCEYSAEKVREEKCVRNRNNLSILISSKSILKNRFYSSNALFFNLYSHSAKLITKSCF